MTYYLWSAGNEHGPYTLTQLLARRDSGQWPADAYWRRETQTDWQPLPALETERQAVANVAERAAAVAALAADTGKVTVQWEPDDTSIFGTALFGFGLLAAVLLLVGGFVEENRISASASASAAGACAVVALIGVALQLNAKLALIAHRLKK